MNGRKVITKGYLAASGAVVFLLCLTSAASYYGWGLSSDAQAIAEARRSSGGSGGGGSVRTGSLHRRRYSGGGPGFGK